MRGSLFCYDKRMAQFELKKLIIRPETEADYSAIDELVTSAFDGRTDLAPFVRAVRASENYHPEYSLVAEVEGRIVGHIMLSNAELEDEGTRHTILTLSPVSVSPDVQKQGIGSKLIYEVLKRADEAGEPLVVLEGSPKYYPRFGFVPAATHNITYTLPEWAAPEAAMVKPLTHDNPALKGHVVYPPAFDTLDSD